MLLYCPVVLLAFYADFVRLFFVPFSRHPLQHLLSQYSGPELICSDLALFDVAATATAPLPIRCLSSMIAVSGCAANQIEFTKVLLLLALSR